MAANAEVGKRWYEESLESLSILARSSKGQLSDLCRGMEPTQIGDSVGRSGSKTGLCHWRVAVFGVSHLFLVDVISICMELEVGIAQVHFLSQWICWMPTMTEAAKWQAPALHCVYAMLDLGEDQLLWAAFWTQSETKIRLSFLRIINAHYLGVWLWACGIGKSSRFSFAADNQLNS